MDIKLPLDFRFRGNEQIEIGASSATIYEPRMTDELTARRKKLLYRASYRGFKEADLLIGGFARAHLGDMNAGELDEFEALLNAHDRDLYGWATGKADPPANLNGSVLARLKTFRLTPG